MLSPELSADVNEEGNLADNPIPETEGTAGEGPDRKTSDGENGDDPCPSGSAEPESSKQGGAAPSKKKPWLVRSLSEGKRFMKKFMMPPHANKVGGAPPRASTDGSAASQQTSSSSAAAVTDRAGSSGRMRRLAMRRSTDDRQLAQWKSTEEQKRRKKFGYKRSVTFSVTREPEQGPHPGSLSASVPDRHSRDPLADGAKAAGRAAGKQEPTDARTRARSEDLQRPWDPSRQRDSTAAASAHKGIAQPASGAAVTGSITGLVDAGPPGSANETGGDEHSELPHAPQLTVINSVSSPPSPVRSTSPAGSSNSSAGRRCSKEAGAENHARVSFQTDQPLANSRASSEVASEGAAEVCAPLRARRHSNLSTGASSAVSDSLTVGTQDEDTYIMDASELADLVS